MEKPKLFWGKQLYYAGEGILAAVAESVVDINKLLSFIKLNNQIIRITYVKYQQNVFKLMEQTRFIND